MPKKRGSKTEIMKRREKLLQLSTDGVSEQKTQALQLGVHPSTVGRDWTSISTIRAPQLEDKRQQFSEELDAMKNFIVKDAKLSDKQLIDCWFQVQDRIARLFGLDEPTKHISVKAELHPDSMYARFMRLAASKFRRPESWKRLWDWIEAQPSDVVEAPSFFKQLPEVTDDTAEPV